MIDTRPTYLSHTLVSLLSDRSLLDLARSQFGSALLMYESTITSLKDVIQHLGSTNLADASTDMLIHP